MNGAWHGARIYIPFGARATPLGSCGLESDSPLFRDQEWGEHRAMHAPEALLAQRYRFERRILAGTKTIAWLVVDIQNGRELVAAAIPAARLKTLRPALGVKHRHLASILDIVEDPDPEAIPSDGLTGHVPAVAVAEHIAGLSLHDQLKGGALGVSDAVAVVAGACDAAEALHRTGAAHGAISPRTIVIAPSAARSSPVLVQLVAPTSGVYTTPERLLGQGPSPEDDVWALHATLYAALMGNVPFEGTTKEELVQSMRAGGTRRLTELGIDEPTLQAVLDRGLSGDARQRSFTITELRSALRGWIQMRAPKRDSMSDIVRLSVMEPRPVIHSAPPIALYDDEEKPEVYAVPPLPSILKKASDEDVLDALRSEAPPLDAEQQAALPAFPLDALLGAPAPETAIRVKTKPPKKPTPPRPPSKPVRTPPQPVAEPEPGAPPPASVAPPAPSPAPLPAQVAPTPAPEPARVRTKPPKKPGRVDSGPANALLPIQAENKAPEVVPAIEEPISKTPIAPAPKESVKPPMTPAPNESVQPPPFDSRRREPDRPGGSTDAQAEGKALPATTVAESKAGGSGFIFALVLLAVLGGVAFIFRNQLKELMSPAAAVSAPRAPTAELTSAVPAPSTAGTEPTPSAAAPTSATPLGSASAAPSGASAAMVGAAGSHGLNACVSSYFSPDTFKGSEDFSFLCTTNDFRGIVGLLHRQIVLSGKGRISGGMKEWSLLSWYELAVTAVVRTACCEAGTPLTLPNQLPGCGTMQETLETVARRPIRAGEATQRAEVFSSFVRCLYMKAVPRPYQYPGQPAGNNRLTFEGFLERAANQGL